MSSPVLKDLFSGILETGNESRYRRQSVIRAMRLHDERSSVLAAWSFASFSIQGKRKTRENSRKTRSFFSKSVT